MRNCPNGIPMYMQHQVWMPKEEDPRGLGGDQISMALSSWNLLYGYVGDASVLDKMNYMASYWPAHGFSGKSDRWGNLPCPYNTALHSSIYDGRHACRKKTSCSPIRPPASARNWWFSTRLREPGNISTPQWPSPIRSVTK